MMHTGQTPHDHIAVFTKIGDIDVHVLAHDRASARACRQCAVCRE